MADPTDAFRTFEHRGWERAAEHYDAGFGPVTRQAVEPLLDALQLAAGSDLLDVACGPGYVAAAAAARGANVVGVDFSAEMVTRARNLHPNLRIEEGDAERLTFADRSFDAVAMNFGMLHLANPEHAIAEGFRVLRPGGRYAFTVWDVPERARAFQIVLESVQKHGEMNVGLPPGPPFFRFSDPAECKRTLEAFGFENVQSRIVPQCWTLDSAGTLLATMRGAAVRTAALLNAQTEEALRAIREEIVRRTEEFRRGPVIELPMPAVLTTGTRPAEASRPMPHVFELAPSGRSKCRGCSAVIPRSALRFGLRVPNPFAEGDMTLWFHPICAAYKRPEALLETLDGAAIEPTEMERLKIAAETSVLHRRLPRIDGAERSPSGQAKCRHCREPIERETWRIRLVFFEDGMFSAGGYIHLKCRGDYFGEPNVVDRVLRFSPTLDADQVEQLKAAFGEA